MSISDLSSYSRSSSSEYPVTTTANTNTTTTSTVTSTSTKTTGQLIPTMVARSHLLERMPEDVRLYFASVCMDEYKNFAGRQVLKLREYGSISKAHYQDVITIFNRNPELGMVATHNALPKLGTFVVGEKEKKVKFNKVSREFFDVYSNAYANFTFPKKMFYTKNILKKSKVKKIDLVCLPKGVREKALGNLFKSKSLQNVVIDLSNNNRALDWDVIHPLSGDFLEQKLGIRKRIDKKEVQEFKSVASEIKSLANSLCSNLEKLSNEKNNNISSMELICNNQPYMTFLVPVVEKLADIGASLDCISHLDLGAKKGRHHALHRKNIGADDLSVFFSYAKNLARFITTSESLQSLSLKNSGLDIEHLEIVMASLRHSKALASIDFSGNYLHSKNGNSINLIDVLVKSIDESSSITSIALMDCNLNDQDADQLIVLLKRLPGIALDLTDNSDISKNHPIFNFKNVESDTSRSGLHSSSS
jgi:hypothetical protein